MRIVLLPAFCLLCAPSSAQDHISYFTGSNTDVVGQPLGGVVLMGGATESDEAMQWFLQRASGGDVLVIRASGSDGYNNYMYNELGIPVNSVETIVFYNANASNDPYVHERIQQAEAIWIAGGNQWNYVDYWRNTPVDSLINVAIQERNIVIGGTSAGMAILGGIYYTAQNASVTSAQALQDPFHVDITLSDAPFIQVPGLESVITDTHYDDPDRRGRHTVFLARAIADLGITDAIGIACEEYTAVCIADDGIAHVFGSYPQYEDHAWFVQANCMTSMVPEVFVPGTPLTWDHEGMAIKACKVPGTTTGQYSFDLNDRITTNGGVWEDWYVQNGSLQTTAGTSAPECTVGIGHVAFSGSQLYADPVHGGYWLSGMEHVATIRCLDMQGRVVEEIRPTSDPQWLPAPNAPMILECASERGKQGFRLMPF